jgi:XTP/dITP diphosphohydrolase
MLLVVATRNPRKLAEVKVIPTLFKCTKSYHVQSLDDMKIDGEVDEIGTSYRENAFLKAEYIVSVLSKKYRDFIVVADDSGLEVEGLTWSDGRLQGQPYPGVDTHQVRARIGSTLGTLRHYRELAGKDQLRLYDCCTLCVIKVVASRPEPPVYLEARIGGKTAISMTGSDKFDYDLYFVPDSSTMTYGQMMSEEKLQHSARGAVLKQLFSM